VIPLPRDLAKAIGVILVAGVRRRFRQASAGPPLKRPRAGGGGPPLLDTGVLRNSYTARVEADGASVGSALPQARLHEFGGTVRAKRAKYLAVPLTVQAKRAGSPRRMPKLTFRPFAKGKPGGVLSRDDGRGRRTDHFLLVPEVTVPARRRAAADAADLRAIDEVAAAFGFRLATAALG
jgi:phage gpG-like protein